MRQNETKNLTKLRSENFENIFNVYQDNNGSYFYNLLQTVVFPQNLPTTVFTKHNISHGETWPLISYKHYDTPNLWWVIMLANKISNPTINPKPGSSVAVPNLNVVKLILSQIQN